MRSKYIITVLFLLFATFLFSQSASIELSTKSSRAQRFYQQAESAYVKGNMNDAERLLQRAVKADDGFIEAWLLLGDVYGDQQKNEEARHAFSKAVEINESFFPPALYFLARLAWEARDYDDAARYAIRLLAYSNVAAEIRSRAQDIYERASFAIWSMENPVPFEPINLGENINSTSDEYINAIRLDDSLLLFTRRFEAEGYELHGRYNEHFYVSTKSDSTWQIATPLITQWPRTDNVGALTISADGLSMYFTACGWPDGFGSCDIYQSTFQNGKWSLPRNLGREINTGNWESQPAISADGTVLYFVSRRSGGKGGSDIWMSNRLGDGKWSKPLNLGDEINTPGNEMAPFIHPDGRTLYFSSDGHIGLGGSDLFISRKDEAGRWQKPVNLGYPINTFGDEINIIVNAIGDKAYISSIREEGFGAYDIYQFELQPEFRPDAVSWLYAVVTDMDSGKALEATYTLIDLAQAVPVQHGQSALPDGNFLISLPSGKDYALHIQKKGYLFFSEHFRLSDETESKPYVIHANLQAVKTGSSVVLKNVFFDTDESVIKAESYNELQVVADFLLENADLKVELGGHTDNVGLDHYNMTLSYERAEAVRNFLVQKGVPQSQMDVNGYGPTKPVSDNETEAGRSLNRRTELVITGQGK